MVMPAAVELAPAAIGRGASIFGLVIPAGW